jgi:hypothetical protein
MEKLEHELWIVQAVNAALGPVVAALLRALGRPVPAHGEVIPDYLVMAGLVVVGWTVLCLIARKRLSVENPGKLQIVLETASARCRECSRITWATKARTISPS